MQMAARVHRPMSRATVLFAGLLAAAAMGLSMAAWERPLGRAAVTPASVHFRVNVNQADAATLRLLPGVGAGLARHLIDHRRRVGPFQKPADLESVYMIGPTTRARLSPWISFGPGSRVAPHEAE